jgi:hypothetical protein
MKKNQYSSSIVRERIEDSEELCGTFMRDMRRKLVMECHFRESASNL